MSVRNLVSTLAFAALTLAPISSQAASLFGHAGTGANAPAASVTKVKMVKFMLSNKTASPMTVLINDQAVTLEANSTTPVRVAEGSDILGADHSTVKIHVTGELSGNTVSFR